MVYTGMWEKRGTKNDAGNQENLVGCGIFILAGVLRTCVTIGPFICLSVIPS